MTDDLESARDCSCGYHMNIREAEARGAKAALEGLRAALPAEIDERVDADEQMNYDLRRFRKLIDEALRRAKGGGK